LTPDPLESRLPRGQAVIGPVVTVHFDGACQPPRGGGVATYGFTVEGDSLDHEESGLAATPWSESSTNNVAEYMAAINALLWLRGRSYHGTVVLLGDSQLVVRQMQGEYEVRSERLRPYHTLLVQLVGEFVEVRFNWVPREENSRADALSKEALAREGGTARRLRPGSAADASGGNDHADEDPSPG